MRPTPWQVSVVCRSVFGGVVVRWQSLSGVDAHSCSVQSYTE